MRQRRYRSLAHYLDAIPTLGCIVSLRSAVVRAHRRAFRHVHALDFGVSLKPHAFLTSGQAPISRHECLRILACSGLHSKFCSKLFAPASKARAGCSSFASSVLRRVVAKLAAATPEVEAACVVSWHKRAAQDELCQFDKMLDDESIWDYSLYDTPRRQTEYAAAAMVQLAASINGRLALVSCGACETLVEFMLQNKVFSVHGCLYPESGPVCIREKHTDHCSCDRESRYFHHWYACAALALEGCASGALRLNRAGWNRDWHAAVNRDETVEDEAFMVLPTPIVLHFIGHHSIRHARMRGGVPRCICREQMCPFEEQMCPLEELTFREFLDTTPGDDQAADEYDEMASQWPICLRLE